MIYQRKYNTATAGATNIHVPLVKRGVVDYAVGADWTPAAGDVTVSKDGGAAANITTLPTALVMGNAAAWVFSFSAAELSCKKLHVQIADAATKAIEDDAFTIETFGDPAAMYPSDISADNTDAEARLTQAVQGNVYGVIGSGSTTTSLVTSALSPAAVATDQFKGRVLVFRDDTTTAALRGQMTVITGSSAGGVLTVQVLTNAPVSGDVFSIT